ncbi:MAG: hypothetical protein M3Y67_08605 [Pseudomonadota bacterium]|nr:hypothetical protein [Pseudomonadota bacterium]
MAPAFSSSASPMLAMMAVWFVFINARGARPGLDLSPGWAPRPVADSECMGK